MRKIARYTVFPLVFGGAMVAAFAGFRAGWSWELVVAGTVFVSAMIIIGLERVMPYVPSWNRSHGDVRTDSLHLVVSMIALPELLRAALFGALLAASVWMTERIGFGLWPTEWPLVLQASLGMVLAELPYYAWHRLQHENAFFWRFHAVHHSAPRLYWLNAARFHPVDTIGGYLFQSPLLVLMGAPEEVIAVFLIFTGVHGLFQHANLDIRLGPLNWIFSMAERHRWHHSRTIDEANTNYGGNLILWDLVFGSAFLPERPPPEDIGIAGAPDYPSGYLAQLAEPFRGLFARDAEDEPHAP